MLIVGNSKPVMSLKTVSVKEMMGAGTKAIISNIQEWNQICLANVFFAIYVNFGLLSG